MAEIATKKLFEKEKIIVWEMVLEPGESSTLTMEPGFTMYLQLKGQELVASEDFRIPITHSARNVGKTRFREILVETK